MLSLMSCRLITRKIEVSVAISDKAEALHALSEELQQLEQLQLKVGEELSVLLFKQMQLAERCRLITHTMEKILK